MLEQTLLNLRVYIILDALDECEAHSRGLILELVNGLVDKNIYSTTSSGFGAALKVLVTGRPGGDMVDHLACFPVLEITDKDTTNDMRMLIQDRMQELASQRHLNTSTQASIAMFLQSNAHGMFIWVVLIMRELQRRDERLTDEAIASKLSRTPLTLMDTYEALLHNAPSTRKQDMWRIIRWLLCASRSLTLAELEAALCFETGSSSWHDFAGDLQYLCGSLTRLDGPRREVNFIHQTARGFLEALLRKSDPVHFEGLDMNTASVNEHLAVVCVQYLQKEDLYRESQRFSRGALTHDVYVAAMQDFIGGHVFLSYAIESWASHARAVDAPSDELCAMIRKLLSSATRRDWIMTFTYFISKNRSWNVPVGQTPLHLAAYFNIPWLARVYVAENNDDVHATTGVNDTPLIWASEMGSIECVTILLDAGADPNEFEIDGWSALHWASRNGHCDIATILLERGAYPFQQDRRGHAPLDWAIDRERWDVVNVLKRWFDKQGFERIDRPSQSRGWINQPRRVHLASEPGQLWDFRPD